MLINVILKLKNAKFGKGYQTLKFMVIWPF